MQYVRCIQNKGNEASLDIGKIYRMLPTNQTEKESGMYRVIDNEDEDYLYPIRWFELVQDEERIDLPEPTTGEYQ